jgi:hypothetical protein
MYKRTFFTATLLGVISGFSPITATAQTYTITDPLVLADSLTQSITRSDARFFDAVFDKEKFAIQVAMTDESNPERAATFSKGMIDKVLMPEANTKTSVLANRFVSQLEVKGKLFQLVKARTREGHPSLLFHTIQENGSVSYIEFMLSERSVPNTKAKALVIDDIYLFSLGTYMSDSFRYRISEGYLGLYAKTTANPILKQLKVLKAIRRLEESQRLEDAFRMTKILKTEKGSYWDKFFKIKRILIAQKLYANDDATYLTVLNDLQRNYATDPATLLYAIDFYTLKKQYANAFKSIDALQTATEDPFLHYQKANIFLLQNETDKAKASLKACTANFSQYDKAYYALTDLLVQRKETAELPEVWNAMLKNLNMPKATLTQILAQKPAIAGLKEFETWRQ